MPYDRSSSAYEYKHDSKSATHITSNTWNSDLVFIDGVTRSCPGFITVYFCWVLWLTSDHKLHLVVTYRHLILGCSTEFDNFKLIHWLDDRDLLLFKVKGRTNIEKFKWENKLSLRFLVFAMVKNCHVEKVWAQEMMPSRTRIESTYLITCLYVTSYSSTYLITCLCHLIPFSEERLHEICR